MAPEQKQCRCIDAGLLGLYRDSSTILLMKIAPFDSRTSAKQARLLFHVRQLNLRHFHEIVCQPPVTTWTT